jgi:FAD/FMN-containing dehydrogenase
VLYTGWTFSGGLSGTTAGRTLGFGVDQVLQLEMVLPNGQHVKVVEDTCHTLFII